MKCVIGVALLLGSTAAVCHAQQMPGVAVRFVLAERSYVAEYTPSEKQQIETAVAEALAKKLSAEIGFLRFLTGAPADYTLTFTLARRDQSTTRADDVGFHASAAGPQLPQRNYYWLMFRPVDAFNQRKGKPEEILKEIKVRTATGSVESLTKEVLSKIPIATAGVHVPGNPHAWVLPFKRKDLCLDPEGSLFRIQNKIRTSLGEETHTFLVDAKGVFDPRGASANIRADKNSVLGFARPPQPGLDVLRQSQSGVVVQAVFMDRYQFNLGLCERIVDPSVAFRPGGLP